MDKNEAKKLKTSFNNYKRVLSWNEFNQRISKKTLNYSFNSQLVSKRLRVASPVMDSRVAYQGSLQGRPERPLEHIYEHASQPLSPKGVTARPGLAYGGLAPFTRNLGVFTGLQTDIKQKFNNLWLGHISDKKLAEHNKNEKYSGLKIELKGRLRGAAKSKKLSNIKGSVKSQSIDYYIEYNKKEIYTKWGILGLKIWLIK